MPVPVIDIFAGPGGLGEGFSSLIDQNNERIFNIVLSIEKEFYAHKTLTLRSFFRQFKPNEVPEEYYQMVRGELPLEELYDLFPEESRNAKNDAWKAELGNGKDSVSNKEVDVRIREALNNSKNWLLIGGPPCQAYSVVGRSRRKEKILDSKKDERVDLYKQYLRILAVHNPAVFIMENVKGLLSAETQESPVFSKILSDLENPVAAYELDYGRNGINLDCPGYRIYSLVVKTNSYNENDQPEYQHRDFLIEAEKYGIPQTRHRVILLGIRNDFKFNPDVLNSGQEISVSDILGGLPVLRSGLSKLKDDDDNWLNVIKRIRNEPILSQVDTEVRTEIKSQLKRLRKISTGTGGNFVKEEDVRLIYEKNWFIDKRIKGTCNHESRGHMESDLLRYFFCACFARVKKRSPKLEDFPAELLPNHKNVQEGIDDRKFADRFRVQISDSPSKTVTSHISKDGHYYIHPDPLQCRSFTVREAARIQTFPDNYFFCGPRTAQFIQVGNAVPPLLAKQIAQIVSKLFESITSNQGDLQELEMVK